MKDEYQGFILKANHKSVKFVESKNSTVNVENIVKSGVIVILTSFANYICVEKILFSVHFHSMIKFQNYKN